MVKSLVTLEKSLSHPANIYPTFVGAVGSWAAPPDVTFCVANTVSPSLNVTVY